MRNIVTERTNHGGVLDVIVSNAHQYYDKAVIYPTVAPDVEGYGVASDHSVAVASQSKDTSKRSGFVRSKVRVRNKVTTKHSLPLSPKLGFFPDFGENGKSSRLISRKSGQLAPTPPNKTVIP